MEEKCFKWTGYRKANTGSLRGRFSRNDGIVDSSPGCPFVVSWLITVNPAVVFGMIAIERKDETHYSTESLKQKEYLREINENSEK